jgi:hypothetical protein
VLVGKTGGVEVELVGTFDGEGMEVCTPSDVIVGAEVGVGGLLDVVLNPVVVGASMEAVDVSTAVEVVGKSALTLRSRPSDEEPQAAATNAREREQRISRCLSILKLYSG